MFQIENVNTNYTLARSENLARIRHLWNHIPARKHTDLILINLDNGEILKTRPATHPMQHDPNPFKYLEQHGFTVDNFAKNRFLVCKDLEPVFTAIYNPTSCTFSIPDTDMDFIEECIVDATRK